MDWSQKQECQWEVASQVSKAHLVESQVCKECSHLVQRILRRIMRDWKTWHLWLAPGTMAIVIIIVFTRLVPSGLTNIVCPPQTHHHHHHQVGIFSLTNNVCHHHHHRHHQAGAFGPGRHHHPSPTTKLSLLLGLTIIVVNSQNEKCKWKNNKTSTNKQWRMESKSEKQLKIRN